MARTELADADFRQKMRDALIKNEKASGQILEDFCSHLYYQAINTRDAKDYGKLVPRLDELHMINTVRMVTRYTICQRLPACMELSQSV